MKHKRRVWVEWGKNVLIAVLLLSAIYLSFQTLVYSLIPDRNNLWEDLESFLQASSFSESSGGTSVLAELIRPVRIAVTTPDGRYGVHYDANAVDAVYEDSASLLAECLLRAETPTRSTAAQWRQALQSVSIYYDFLGDIPLSILAAGLGQGSDNPVLTQSARRLLLADDGQGGAVLWFWDSQSNAPYFCETSSVFQGQLEQTISQYLPNNAIFAFQSNGKYDELNASQLITSETPFLPVYASANPLAADTAQTESLLRLVGINPHALYASPDGTQVAKDGSCIIRIGASGAVHFSAGEEDSNFRLPISAAGDTATAVEAVEAAWALLSRTLTSTLEDGRVYLISCEETETGWDIQFGYQLSGAQVEFADDSCAARFVVEGRRISEFTMQLRTYTATGQSSVLLPETQAVAALLALYGSGNELLAAYLDSGEESLQASWIAR